MSPAVTVSACPVADDLPREPADPSPDTLTYSLTLPSDFTSPGVARAVTRSVLYRHGLAELTDAAVQTVAELVGCACRFSGSADVYVSLRHREGALRIVSYDGHPRHSHPRLAEHCEARRRAELRVLACVVRVCEGEWGFGDAREPGGGTRMWAVLPRAGARGY
ncbi:ATP-binding protein [Streptomyces sp. NBC_00820]|uniref:ATP-binding protein n=1 Tax=Streptomyces sp. NBC_00820 TaxID=2975842 RepID=UPI002ED31706|nr:ATP-binding protein [Streptomyces sp. NBC_00820]